MPLVNIHMMEGRPPEKIEAMTTAVAQAIAAALDAPIESVRIMVDEMRPHQYSVGGKPYRVIQAERAAAESSSG